MSDEALACRDALDRLATLLADLRFVEDAMAHLDAVDTRVTPPDATAVPAGVLTCVTYRIGSTHPIERPVMVYDDAGFEARTAPVIARLAEAAGRWARDEVDHLVTACRPVLAVTPHDTAGVRDGLLGDRQALTLGVDTDLADLRLRLAPWHGRAKTSYLLDFQGPLVDAHAVHTAALKLCAKAVAAIGIAARGAQLSLRSTLEAGTELVDTLLRGWQAAQAPPTEEVKDVLALAARGADLLALVAMPKPEVSRAARLTGQGLRWLEQTIPDAPDVDLPPGVVTRDGRLAGADASQTAGGLADGVSGVVAALDEVLAEVGAATRGHEDLLAQLPLAPLVPETPRPGTFDHGHGAA